jgi:hypothetical protein
MEEAREGAPFKWNSNCFGSPPGSSHANPNCEVDTVPLALKMPISDSSEAAISLPPVLSTYCQAAKLLPSVSFMTRSVCWP